MNPDDLSAQFRICRSFWIKIQDKEALEIESNYRFLAVAVLKRAAAEMWTREDLEKACERYETTKQYGNKIEIADFFTSKAVEKFLSYREVLAAIHDDGLRWSDFDGYKTEGDATILWRRHDGRTLPGLEKTHDRGEMIMKPPRIAAAVTQKEPEPDAETLSVERQLKRQAIEIGKLSLENSGLRKENKILRERVAQLEAFYNS